MLETRVERPEGESPSDPIPAELIPAALAERLDLAAYQARLGPARRRQARALARQCEVEARGLPAPAAQAVAQVLAENQELSRRAAEREGRARRESVLALGAAVLVGALLCQVLGPFIAQVRLDLSVPRLIVQAPPPQRAVAFASGSGAGATGGPPPAPPAPPADMSSDATRPTSPAPEQAPPPAPVVADAPPRPDPEAPGVAASPTPAPVQAPPDAVAQDDAPAPALATAALVHGGSTHRGTPGQPGQPGGTGLRLPDGTGAGRTALEHEAPMAFRKVGPGPDPGLGSHADAPPGLEVARTEVTQAQWTALMGLDLASVSGQWEHPAEAMSWCDALRYANRLSLHEGLRPAYKVDHDCERAGGARWDRQAEGYRLLTEAEWLALAKESGPPPVPGDGHTGGESNNRGLGRVDQGQHDARYGLVGMADNGREWIWGSPLPSDPAERWVHHDNAASRAVARGCGTFARVHPTPGDPWCREVLDGAQVPLGVGLRLARGQLAEE